MRVKRVVPQPSAQKARVIVAPARTGGALEAVKSPDPRCGGDGEYWGLKFDSEAGCIRARRLRKRRVRNIARLEARHQSHLRLIESGLAAEELQSSIRRPGQGS